MANKELLLAVGKYIDMYYMPECDDIAMDNEIQSISDEKSFINGGNAVCDESEDTKEHDNEDEISALTEVVDDGDVCSFLDSLILDEFDECEYYEVEVIEVDAEENDFPLPEPLVTEKQDDSVQSNRRIEDLMEQLEETFSQRLLRMIDERGMTDSEAYNRAYVDRRHFSKIRNDINYSPSKKVVLAFSVALKLSMDEAKDLLNCAGFALSRSSKTDIIIAYCLQNNIYDMFEINDLLEAYEQPIF